METESKRCSIDFKKVKIILRETMEAGLKEGRRHVETEGIFNCSETVFRGTFFF